MTKRSQSLSAKGWKNLEKNRRRPETAGRKPKQVIAVTDEGRFHVFPFIGAAAQWIGGNRSLISRCCRYNQARKVNSRDWSKGRPKGSGCVNTDHRIYGVRFYYEDDDVWIEKIKTK